MLNKINGKQTLGEIVSTYPGATVVPNQPLVGGTLAVEYVPNADALLFRGVFNGLNASSRGGWHVHDGFSCNSHAEDILRYSRSAS